MLNAGTFEDFLHYFVINAKCRIKRGKYRRIILKGPKNHVGYGDVGYTGVKYIKKIGNLPGPSKLCRTTRIIGHAVVG